MTFKNFTGKGTEKFNDFAISFVPNQEDVTLPELVKFYLYPRAESEVYRNYTIQIGFKFHRFSIYYSQDMFDDGFRISNLTCYSKLVDYFRQSAEDQVIKVKENGSSGEDVKVFGFLSLV